jgi:hypothetical protein
MTSIRPEVERLVLERWSHGWSVWRIRKNLVERFDDGKDITSSMIYNLLTKARKRGDKRATRRRTTMIVNAS